MLVDTPAPAAVDESSLTTFVTVAWALELDNLHYVPKGAGSYHWMVERDGLPTHFITVDDLDTKPWIGRDRDSTFDGLDDAYETAWVLFHEDRVDAVVAPIRCVNGAVTARLSDQFSVAAFPYINGAAGNWGEPISQRDHIQLLHELARLHEAGVARRGRIRHRPHELAERDALLAALATVDQPWHGGEFSEPARRALSLNAARVHELLARYDSLAAQLDASVLDVVVTHGEPHPGNLIHVGDEVRLIDWDTVALAEPERDLWMLDNGDDDALHTYTALTARPINRIAIEFYRSGWTLSDIASFADMFRAEHPHTEWTEIKWKGFVHLLEGGESTPYASD